MSDVRHRDDLQEPAWLRVALIALAVLVMLSLVVLPLPARTREYVLQTYRLSAAELADRGPTGLAEDAALALFAAALVIREMATADAVPFVYFQF